MSLRETVAALPLSARLLLLSEGLGAVVFLIWLIQSRRLSTASDNSGQRSARVSLAAAWIGLIFFSASFLAAIFGYVSLANILVDLYLWSAYLITILYGAIRIVDGLVLIILWMGPLVTLRVVRAHRVMLHQRILSCSRPSSIGRSFSWCGSWKNWSNTCSTAEDLAEFLIFARL